jgi:hypothetical protein
MKNISLVLLSISLLLSTVLPASAQITEVKQIQVGKITSDPLELYLTPGQGITIDYRQLGQTIETMWLDNKRYVGVSTDGDLLHPSQSGKDSTSSTSNSSATVPAPASALHLNLIDSQASTAIEKYDRSLITVITVDSQKNRHYYLYRIYPSYIDYNSNNISLIEYTMPTAIIPAQENKKLAKTIKLMISQGLIRDLELIGRTDKLLSLIESGISIEQAAKQAGLSPKFINGILAYPGNPI